MVRETRHLWVGNLPETVREEKIVEHFTRYGRVESVKILPKRSAEGGRAAFVDFVDIRSATKAHESPNRISDRELRTDYNEPSAPSSVSRHHESMNRSAPSSPTRSSRRYERRGEGISEGRPYYSEGYSDDEGSIPRSGGGSMGRSRYSNTRRPAYKPEAYRQSPARSSISGSGSGRSRSQSASSSSSSGESGDEGRSMSPSSSMPRTNRRAVLRVKNLSSRSSDSSVKEGMYHEFKKYGEVPRIHIHGQGSSRYATVHFRRPDDAERALQACQGKMLMGSDMEVQPWGEDRFHSSDAPSRPRTSGFGLAPDEDFDPACTRTLFVGNIEKTTTCSDLREAFGRFGEIMDVDIKKSGGNNPYAFLQFEELSCAIQARRRMDREFVGRNRVKVGFGKVAAINTIWVGGVTASLSEQQIERHFSRYGRVTRVLVDRARGQALVSFDGVEAASFAQAEMKGRTMFGRRVQVELVSRDSRQLFYDTLQRGGGGGDGHSSSRRYEPSSPPPVRSRGRGGTGHYDNRRGRGGAHGGMRRDSRNSGYRSSWHGGQYDYPEGGRAGGGFHRQTGSRNRFEGNFDNDDYDQELREYDYSRQRERERERAQQRRDRHPRDHDDGNYGNSGGDRFYPEHRNERDRWPDDDSSSGSYEESRDRKAARSRDYEAERGRDYAPEAEGRGSRKSEYHREERKERQQTRRTSKSRTKPAAESATSTDGGAKEPDSENSSSEDGRGGSKKHHAPRRPPLEPKLPPPAVGTRYADSPERGEVDGKRRDVGGDLVSSSIRVDKEAKAKKKRRARTPVRSPEREHTVEGGEERSRNASPIGEDSGRSKDEGRGAEQHKVNHELAAPDTETRLSKSPSEGREDWEQSSRASRKPYRDDRARDWAESAEKPKRRRASRDGSPHSPAHEPASRSPRKLHREERARDWDESDVRRPSHWSPREESPPPPPPPPPPPEQVALSLDGRVDDRGIPTPPSRAPYDVAPVPVLLESASYAGNGLMRPSPHGEMHSPVLPPVVPPSPAMPLPPTGQLDAPPVAGHSPGCGPIMSGGSVPPTPPPPAAPSNPDTLLELLRRYPVVWQGLLALKNDTAAVQMHYLAGNARLAELSLPQPPQVPGIGSVPPPIRIAQRMRLEPSQLDGVIRRMQSESEHCLLLALPCGRDPLDVHKQTRGLKSGFISYLQHKQAAGIINVPRPGSRQPSYVLHIFPPCDFAQGHLARVAPDLLDSAADSGHLMVVVASV